MRSVNDGRLRSKLWRPIMPVSLAILLMGGCNPSPLFDLFRGDGLKGPLGGTNAAKTKAYLKKIEKDFPVAPGAFFVDSYCPNENPCVESEKAQLMFVAQKKAHTRDWKKALRHDEEGHIVAKVINVGTIRYAPFDLGPGEVAYAWIGQANDAGARGFAVYKLDSNSGNVLAMGWDTPTVKYCKYESDPSWTESHLERTHHQTSGETCSSITVSDASSSISAAYAATTTLSTSLAIGAGQLWISCSGGCCQIKTT